MLKIYLVKNENAEKYPKAPKPGYKTEPSHEDMMKMRVKDLENLQRFVIYNEFGKIEFLVPAGRQGIDVTEVDL